MDNTNSNNSDNSKPLSSTVTKPPASPSVVDPAVSLPSPETPIEISPPLEPPLISPSIPLTPETSHIDDHNHSHKLIIIMGIILTIIASIGIAGTAISTYLNKTKNIDNQVSQKNVISTVFPTTSVDESSIRMAMVKEIVLTDEDPTRPGVPVEKKTTFNVKTGSIYVTVVLDKPIIGTKISFVRYLNSKYIDHGTVIVSKSDSKYVHFSFTLANLKAIQPIGTYLLKIYVDGQVVKTVSYDVTS